MKDIKQSKIMLKQFKQFEKEIAVVIAVQKIGIASIEEIRDKCLEWKLNLAPKEIQILAEKLRRRDLLSIIYKKENNETTIRYGLNKVKNIPPVANYRDIVDYPEGKELLNYLEQTKGVNKGREPDIKNYWDAKLKFKVTGLIRGFKNNENDICEHYRDENGNIIFETRHIRSFLKGNLRIVNKPESQSDYIGGFGICKNPKLIIDSTTILAQKTGSGYKKWECIKIGNEIEWNVTVPSTLFQPQEFEAFIKRICNNKMGLVGFGAWGKSNVGNLMLTEFKVQ